MPLAAAPAHPAPLPLVGEGPPQPGAQPEGRPAASPALAAAAEADPGDPSPGEGDHRDGEPSPVLGLPCATLWPGCGAVGSPAPESVPGELPGHVQAPEAASAHASPIADPARSGGATDASENEGGATPQNASASEPGGELPEPEPRPGDSRAAGSPLGPPPGESCDDGDERSPARNAEQAAVAATPAARPPPPAEPRSARLRDMEPAPPAAAPQPLPGPPPSGGSEVPQAAADRVLARLLHLVRDIRRPREWVGYSAFLCMALSTGRRPFMWEGESRVDLVGQNAPWAADRCRTLCAVDGVCCCLQPAAAVGRARLMPVSDAHPLGLCKHYLAAASMGGSLAGEAHDIEGFYSTLGVAVLGTVMDGDCGIDVMCQMLSLPQTFQQRLALREDPGTSPAQPMVMRARKGCLMPLLKDCRNDPWLQ